MSVSKLYTRTNSHYFFFFQAEDGIRDLTVTGVQTCALPISRSSRRDAHRIRPRCPRSRLRDAERSEERRVGKECRSRWSRAHQKKKTQDSIGYHDNEIQ